MSEYKLTINGAFYGNHCFPGFNDYRQRQTTSPYVGARLLRDAETICINNIRKQFLGVKFTSPVIVHFYFYEPDRRRDLDNILGFAEKAVLDSMQQAGVLPNDNQHYIRKLSAEIINDKNPRIEVVFEEE